MNPVVYQCLGCGTQATSTVPVLPPQKWQWDQRQVPRLLCPQCGCACYPQEWWNVAFDICAQHEAQGMNIHAMAHSKWSSCPNSHECKMVGTYAGNCEQAQAVMPKCLVAIHSRLEQAERRPVSLERTPPSRPRARPASAAPTSASQKT